MDACVNIDGAELHLVSNTGDEQVARNVASAMKRGLPELVQRPENGVPVCIVGGGPSLLDTLPLLKRHWHNYAHIWAINGTHDWLLGHGIVPNRAWLVDSRPGNVTFYRKPHGAVQYCIASRCDPLIFDTLAKQNVLLWHDANCGPLLPEGKTLIGGGGVMGIKAMTAAYALGHREIHLFGMDSSYQDATHHAYPQPMNDGEWTDEVTLNGRTFRASRWMVAQTQYFGMFANALADEGCAIHVHGDGLLPWVAREMQRQIEAAA